MADIKQIARNDLWDELISRIEGKDHPTPDEFADFVGQALAFADAPEEVKSYMVERLRGEIHLGDGGRPPNDQERWAVAYGLNLWVALVEAAFRMIGPARGARTRAYEVVARSAGDKGGSITTHSLKRKLRVPKEADAFYQQKPRHVEEILRQMIEDGEVKLDPTEGLVWL